MPVAERMGELCAKSASSCTTPADAETLLGFLQVLYVHNDRQQQHLFARCLHTIQLDGAALLEVVSSSSRHA